MMRWAVVGVVCVVCALVVHLATSKYHNDRFVATKLRLTHELQFSKQTMEVQMSSIHALQEQIKTVQDANRNHRALCEQQTEAESLAVERCQTALAAANSARDMLHENLPAWFNNLDDRLQAMS